MSLKYEPSSELGYRCRANMAHIRQSRPGSGLGSQVKVLETVLVVTSLLGSGCSLFLYNTQPVEKSNYCEVIDLSTHFCRI